MANTSIYNAFERMWQHVVAALGDKVSKVEGKGLSTNDFTNEYKGKVDSALQSFTETDPTVPAWAKAANKPTYTAAEVGLGNVNNTADSAKSVKYATSAGSATKATQDAAGNVIIDTYATKAEMEARSVELYPIALPVANWVGSAAPYSQTISLTDILASDRPKVYFEVPVAFADLESQQSAFATLYDVETANGSVTFKAKELPEVAFNVTLEVSRT